jgi:hypothetical protein
LNFKDKLVQTFEDAKDSVNEALHRSEANAEQAKRDVAGEEMTPAEHASSMMNQAKNNVQADIDKTKRDLRNDE